MSDYQLLACPSFDKYKPKESRCSRKDLTGKIKVYTKKCVKYAIMDENLLQKFTETKEASTQTKPIPSYATPLNKKLFDKLYIEEDMELHLPKIHA